MSNPLVQIHSHYKTMTNSERKVADYITEHTDDILYLTITDLAEKAQVGEATVIRFCRKLSYRGYQELKLAIAQNLVEETELVDNEINQEDTTELITRKITQHNMQTMKDTHDLLDLKELSHAMDAIQTAGRITFIGIGSSGMTALDGAQRFMRMGYCVQHTSDAHFMAMQASLTTESDVIIGISSSGSTKDVVDAIRIAKENGAFVICITNHARSPVTQFADAILLASSKESPLQGGAFTSKIAQLHVLDIMTKVIEMRNMEEVKQAVEKTAQAVSNKLY